MNHSRPIRQSVLIAAAAVALAAGCSPTPPLVGAAKSDSLDLSKALIDSGAKLDEKGSYDYTALHWAAYNGDATLAKMLVDKGANINAREYTYATPLILASEYSHPDVVSVLVTHHADLDAKDNKNWTALMWASRDGNMDIVKTLVDAGADQNWADPKNHDTALSLALAKQNLEVVDYLTHPEKRNAWPSHNDAGNTSVAISKGAPTTSAAQGVQISQPITAPLSVHPNPPTTNPGRRPNLLPDD